MNLHSEHDSGRRRLQVDGEGGFRGDFGPSSDAELLTCYYPTLGLDAYSGQVTGVGTLPVAAHHAVVKPYETTGAERDKGCGLRRRRERDSLQE